MRRLTKEDVESLGVQLHAVKLVDVNTLLGLVGEYSEQPSTAQFGSVLEFVQKLATQAYDEGLLDGLMGTVDE